MAKAKKRNKEYALQWNKETTTLFTVCLILLLIALTLCGIHVYRVVSKYRSFLDSSIIGQTSLDAEIVGTNLNTDIQVITATAEQLQQNENYDVDSDEQIYKLLQGVCKKSSLARAVLITTDGKVYSSEKYSTMSDKLKELIPLAAKDGSAIICKTYYDLGDGMASYCVMIPIIHRGITQGYLFGINSTVNLLDGTETDTYAEISRSYVVNDDGVIMAVSNSDVMFVMQNDDFYEDVLDNLKEPELKEIVEEKLRKGFAERLSGVISIDEKDDEYKFYYAPVESVKGWTYVNVVAMGDVTALVRTIKLESIVSILIVIILMLFICFLIGRFVINEQQQMLKLAFEDSLTQAPNERFFTSNALKMLKDYPDIAYRIICFDIQNFRYLNESYGHMKADEVLRIIVRNVEKDLGTRETFARIGADRFTALVVDDGRTEERLLRIEERIAKAAATEMINYPIKIKCGFYEVKDRKENIAAMIDKANLARKSIGGDGKGLMAVYEDSLMEETRRREFIESKMEMALITGEFVVFLQPKWDMKENHIIASEALVRWKQKGGSIIPPNDFIPIFEKNGFIEKIDFYMLEEVCKYLRKMIDEGRKVYPVSVNQSRYLLHDPQYTMNVQQILLKYKIPKGLIELEITETVFFQERERMLEVMEELKRLNLNLSIDDFGSGFSSLNLLRDMPFDVLKIDRGFLNETNGSESGKFILRKIVEMADGLGIKVICEGVETREQVEMLLDIGCMYAQGYLYSKPIEKEDFIEKFNKPIVDI